MPELERGRERCRRLVEGQRGGGRSAGAKVVVDGARRGSPIGAAQVKWWARSASDAVVGRRAPPRAPRRPAGAAPRGARRRAGRRASRRTSSCENRNEQRRPGSSSIIPLRIRLVERVGAHARRSGAGAAQRRRSVELGPDDGGHLEHARPSPAPAAPAAGRPPRARSRACRSTPAAASCGSPPSPTSTAPRLEQHPPELGDQEGVAGGEVGRGCGQRERLRRRPRHRPTGPGTLRPLPCSSPPSRSRTTPSERRRSASVSESSAGTSASVSRNVATTSIRASVARAGKVPEQEQAGRVGPVAVLDHAAAPAAHARAAQQLGDGQVQPVALGVLVTR